MGVYPKRVPVSYALGLTQRITQIKNSRAPSGVQGWYDRCNSVFTILRTARSFGVGGRYNTVKRPQLLAKFPAKTVRNEWLPLRGGRPCSV